MNAPTVKQLRILSAIIRGWENYHPPTLRELCARFGIASTNGMADHLRALRKKGLLHPSDYRARMLVPTRLGLRVAGRYSRGAP